MKQLIIFAGCCIILTSFAGCRGKSEKLPEAGPTALPPHIAGTWKADGSPWKIVLSPQGEVTSAVIPLGEAEVKPNQTTEIQGRKEEPGIFEAGDFEAYYDPENRELLVSIEIKRVYVEMGSILEGTCEYFVTGNVSENGKVWHADVFTSLDLTAFAPDPNSTAEKPAFRQIGVLQGDPSDGSEQFIFTKVENSGNKK